MIYSLLYRHYSFCTVFWVSSFYLSVNIVVLYQSTFTCLEHFAPKVEALALGRKKKKCFRVVDDAPEKKGIVLWKQMSSKWSTFCPQTLPELQFILGLHFTLSRQSSFCILPRDCLLLSVCSLHFTPGPQLAVCTPESAFYTDRISLHILDKFETQSLWPMYIFVVSAIDALKLINTDYPGSDINT